MTLLSPDRTCSVCKKIITFDEFLVNHPQYSKARALQFWNDKILTVLCSECFLNAPEKPYKKNRYTYFESYFRH